MTSPCLINLLQFVEPDIKSLKLRALNDCELGELIVREIEPLKVRERVIVTEYSYCLDLILRDVKFHKVQKLSNDRDVDNVVVLEVEESDMLCFKD